MFFVGLQIFRSLISRESSFPGIHFPEKPISGKPVCIAGQPTLSFKPTETLDMYPMPMAPLFRCFDRSLARLLAIVIF